MKKGIVIALSCYSGSSNKTFNAGDEVNESCFPEGQFASLVQQGFLEEIKEDKEVEVPEVPLISEPEQPVVETPLAEIPAVPPAATEPAAETLLEKAKKNNKK